MPGILERLGEIDFSSLNAQLKLADSSVDVQITADFAGLDPRSLLGELGTLLAATDGLPSSPAEVAAAVTAGMEELSSLLKLPALEAGAEVAATVAELVERLEALSAPFQGDIQAFVESLLSEMGGLDTIVSEIAGRLAELVTGDAPAGARLPLEALKGLAEGAPANPTELAQLLTRLIAGLDLSALTAPTALVQQLLVSLSAAGGDLAGVGAQIDVLTARARVALDLMLAPEVDVDGVVSALDRLRVDIDSFFSGALPDALSHLSLDLGALDVEAVTTRLEELLAPLLPDVNLTGEAIEETLVASLQGLAVYLESLTPLDITALFDDVIARLQQSLSEVPELDGLALTIDDLFDVIVAQVRRVPVADLRDGLLDALTSLEGRVREFAGFGDAFSLADKLSSVQQAIDSLDTAAVQQRVQQFAGRVRSAADSFPIAAIRGEVEAIVASVAEAIAAFAPALDSLNKQVDALAAQIEAVDLSAAASASVDLMADIRAKVREVTASDDIPDALKVAIAAAATALKQVDFTVEVRAPFAAKLDGIDPAVLLAPLESALTEVREKVELVTPAAIVERLEDPYERLLALLGRFKPEALLDSLGADFKSYLDLVDKADPRTLIEPIEARFRALLAELRRAIDPAALFRPLRDAFARLQQLLDLLDFRSLLGGVVGKVSNLPELMGQAVQSSLAARPGGSVASPPDTGAPFRFGDVLRPLAALIAQLKRRLLALAEGLLREGWDLVAAPLAALRRLTDPEHGLLAEAGQAVQARLDLIDPFAPGGPVAGLRSALRELALAGQGLALSGSAGVRVGTAAASVQIDTRLEGLAAAREAVDGASNGLQARLAPPDLTIALQGVGRTLAEAIPAPLLTADPPAAIAARLSALFDVIDPAPLVAQLDAIGDRVMARLQALAREIAQGLFRVWDLLISEIEKVMPGQVLARIDAGLDRVKAEFNVLDVVAIEAEINAFLDDIVGLLEVFSPASLAADLGLLFDALKAKLAALNPATLLGNLDPLAGVIEHFEGLRPSVVFAPLLVQTAGLAKSLEQLTSVRLGEALLTAVAGLRASLDGIIEGLEAELQGLLDELGALSGEASVSVNAG